MKTEAYTPEEVAKLFKISKHTVYELVKRGELHAFKIGNKMRIAPQEIVRYMENGQPERAPSHSTVHSLAIAGSHDFLIEALIKYISRQNDFFSLQPSFIGSLEGLMTLYRGASDIAAVHLLDQTTKQYNLPFIKQLFVHEPITVIRLASREQGLIVQPGNPRQIHTIRDLADKPIIFVNRQKGSGTRFLLDSMLADEAISPDRINGYEECEWTHLNLGLRIQRCQADAGLGIRSAASQLGLDFIPLKQEHFDLVFRWTKQNERALTHLQDLLELTDFGEFAASMEGYDCSELGNMIYSTYGGHI